MDTLCFDFFVDVVTLLVGVVFLRMLPLLAGLGLLCTDFMDALSLPVVGSLSVVGTLLGMA